MVTWGQPLRVQAAAEEAEAAGRMATSRKRYLGAAGRAGSRGSPGSTSVMGQSRRRAAVAAAAAESERWGVGVCGGVGLG